VVSPLYGNGSSAMSAWAKRVRKRASEECPAKSTRSGAMPSSASQRL
jgi:hypothetical protein